MVVPSRQCTSQRSFPLLGGAVHSRHEVVAALLADGGPARALRVTRRTNLCSVIVIRAQARSSSSRRCCRSDLGREFLRNRLGSRQSCSAPLGRASRPTCSRAPPERIHLAWPFPTHRWSIGHRRVRVRARHTQHFARNVAIDHRSSDCKDTAVSIAARLPGHDRQPPLALCRSRLACLSLCYLRCCLLLALRLSVLKRHGAPFSVWWAGRRGNAPSCG